MRRPTSSSSAAPITRHDAHLATSLQFKVNLIWIYCARPLIRWLNGCADFRTLEFAGLDDPGRTLAGLRGSESTSADHAQHGHLACTEPFGGLFERQLSPILALAGLVDRDAAIAAERAHPHLRPALPPPGAMAKPIEQRGYAGVVELTRQLRDQRLNLDIGRPPMLSLAVLHDVQRSVVAALPVDDEFDPRLGDPRHDLLDHGSQDPLAPFIAGRRMAPSAGQVGAESK